MLFSRRVGEEWSVNRSGKGEFHGYYTTCSSLLLLLLCDKTDKDINTVVTRRKTESYYVMIG